MARWRWPRTCSQWASSSRRDKQTRLFKFQRNTTSLLRVLCFSRKHLIPFRRNAHIPQSSVPFCRNIFIIQCIFSVCLGLKLTICYIESFLLRGRPIFMPNSNRIISSNTPRQNTSKEQNNKYTFHKDLPNGQNTDKTCSITKTLHSQTKIAYEDNTSFEKTNQRAKEHYA